MKAPRISTEISKKLEMTIGKRCDEKQIISFRTLSLDRAKLGQGKRQLLEWILRCSKDLGCDGEWRQ